jgi:septum site-determining protein MinC
MAVTAAATATRLQGGIFTLMVVKIGDPQDPALDREIAEQVALSPGFFADAPVILDLKDSIACTSVAEFTALRQVLRRHGLIAVGVQNASTLQLRAAKAVDLAAVSPGGGAGNAPRRAAPERAAAPERERAAPAAAGRLVTQPVRSGTQIYAQGGDLVIMAPVSAGAEVIADGHIHVYGALRGRAIAGASGDTAARIFTYRLEAELVAIAGRYMVNEAILPEYLHQAAQVALIDDRLSILPSLGGGRGTGEG